MIVCCVCHVDTGFVQGSKMSPNASGHHGDGKAWWTRQCLYCMKWFKRSDMIRCGQNHGCFQCVSGNNALLCDECAAA